jgi:uncharacterized protein YbaR (Trm112 family)
MARAAVFALTMLFNVSAHAGWGEVITAFVGQIKDVPAAIDALIRVAVNTPVDLVSCQRRRSGLTDVQAPLLEVIASKTSLQTRLEVYVLSPSSERWSRITDTVPVLLTDLRQLGETANDKARQFTASKALSDAFIDLAISIESRKIDILQDLQNLPEPKTPEELSELSAAAAVIGGEIERLRSVKDSMAIELSKGC